MIEGDVTLADLREAIAQQEWYECEEIIRELIQNLSPREAVRLAVRQVRQFLPALPGGPTHGAG